MLFSLEWYPKGLDAITDAALYQFKFWGTSCSSFNFALTGETLAIDILQEEKYIYDEDWNKTPWWIYLFIYLFIIYLLLTQNIYIVKYQ